jgi:hypothetical protein
MTAKERNRLMEIVHRLEDLKVATSRDAERRQVRVNVADIPALNMGDADFLLDILHREVVD